MSVAVCEVLKQRHTLLDDQLKTLIEQYPQLQVLEIASGLSPRGWWFRQHYPEITYRELDLPDGTNQTSCIATD
jgi:O-methyltransferase involved in polyketide biosynthesis